MFSISEFIKVNRVYFIWAVFLSTLYLFRSMFGLVFMTFIMCFIFASIGHKIRRKYHWNRRVIVVSLYLLFLLFEILFVAVVPTKLINETISFTEQLPKTIYFFKNWIDTQTQGNEILSMIVDQLSMNISPDKTLMRAWSMSLSFLHVGIHYIGWFFLAMLFSFLILLDLPTLSLGIRKLRDTKLAETYKEIAGSVVLFAKVVGENFRAQLIISAINTFLTAIGLYFLGIKAIALLCTIVFICGLIPVLGMIISSVPILLMAVNTGGMVLGLWAFMMIIFIHVLEAYVLNPRIVSSVMHINPVMTLIILYIAHSFLGLWGMLLGVPIAVYFYRKINVLPTKTVE